MKYEVVLPAPLTGQLRRKENKVTFVFLYCTILYYIDSIVL